MAVITEILVIANLASWFLLFRRDRRKPLSSSNSLSTRHSNSDGPVVPRLEAMLVVYFTAILAQDMAMIASGFSNVVFTIFFTAIVVYEFFIIGSISAEFSAKNSAVTLLAILISELMIIAMIATLIANSFDLLNIVDFLALVVKTGICFFVLGKIIIGDALRVNLELFIITFSFLVFFCFQMVVSFYLAKSFNDNYNLNTVSLIFSYTLWLGVSGILWKSLLK